MRLVACAVVALALLSFLRGHRVARWMLEGGTLDGRPFTRREIEGFAVLNVALWAVGLVALIWLAATS